MSERDSVYIQIGELPGTFGLEPYPQDNLQTKYWHRSSLKPHFSDPLPQGEI